MYSSSHFTFPKRTCVCFSYNWATAPLTGCPVLRRCHTHSLCIRSGRGSKPSVLAKKTGGQLGGPTVSGQTWCITLYRPLDQRRTITAATFINKLEVSLCEKCEHHFHCYILYNCKQLLQVYQTLKFDRSAQMMKIATNGQKSIIRFTPSISRRIISTVDSIESKTRLHMVRIHFRTKSRPWPFSVCCKPTPTGQALNPWAKFRHRVQAHIPAHTISVWGGLGQKLEVEQEAHQQLTFQDFPAGIHTTSICFITNCSCFIGYFIKCTVGCTFFKIKY